MSCRRNGLRKQVTEAKGGPLEPRERQDKQTYLGKGQGGRERERKGERERERQSAAPKYLLCNLIF